MKIGDSREIFSLLRLATFTPQSYRRLIVCAPFISNSVLLSHIFRNGAALLPTVIITHPETAKHLAMTFQNYKDLTLGAIPRLHAKIYIACGIVDEDSIALIGSFNMTMAALNGNFELGVRVTACSSQHRRLIRSIENRLLSMAQFICGGA